MSRIYEQLLDDASSYVNARYDEGYFLSREQLEQIHLRGSEADRSRPILYTIEKVTNLHGV